MQPRSGVSFDFRERGRASILMTPAAFTVSFFAQEVAPTCAKKHSLLGQRRDTFTPEEECPTDAKAGPRISRGITHLKAPW